MKEKETLNGSRLTALVNSRVNGVSLTGRSFAHDNDLTLQPLRKPRRIGWWKIANLSPDRERTSSDYQLTSKDTEVRVNNPSQIGIGK